MLNRLEGDGLVARTRSERDRRRQVVGLTAKGRREFQKLDRRSNRELGDVLRPYTDEEQRQLVEAMSSIRTLLGEPLDRRRLTIREAEAGDHGWILERHAHVFPYDAGWGESFVALVAGIIAEYLDDHDPTAERCWIAALEGQRAGAVYCVRRSAEVAQLRLLFVEDWARRLGIGGRLVERCIRFARRRGYERMVLWTNSSLES